MSNYHLTRLTLTGLLGLGIWGLGLTHPDDAHAGRKGSKKQAPPTTEPAPPADEGGGSTEPAAEDLIPAIRNGVIYETISPVYPLRAFEKSVDTIQLYSYCGFAGGCDWYGQFADPYALTFPFGASSAVISFESGATLLRSYEFVPLGDGTVEVLEYVIQCYPDICGPGVDVFDQAPQSLGTFRAL